MQRSCTLPVTDKLSEEPQLWHVVDADGDRGCSACAGGPSGEGENLTRLVNRLCINSNGDAGQLVATDLCAAECNGVVEEPGYPWIEARGSEGDGEPSGTCLRIVGIDLHNEQIYGASA